MGLQRVGHNLQLNNNIEYTPRVKPSVNYTPGVIMMHQCSGSSILPKVLLRCSKTRDMWQFSVLSAEFCCEAKTDLKNKIF